MTLHTAQSVMSFLLFGLSYTVLVTFAGAFRAWVAQCMGDDTAADQGFLTLDPLVHIDPMGLMCIYFFRIGWGRPVPIDPHNIKGKWRLIVTYLSHVFIYIALGIIALLLFGILLICTGKAIHEIESLHSSVSAFIFVLFTLLQVFVRISAWLGALAFIRSGFKLFMLLFFPDLMQREDMTFLITFAPLGIMILFMEQISDAISAIIEGLGAIIGVLLHIF